MPLILQPSTKENAPQRAEVQLGSYINDPLFNSFMPNAPKEVRMKFFTELLTKDMDKSGVKNLEIIDSENGKVVAFAQWKYPTLKESHQEIGFEEITSFPEGTNLPFAQGVFALSGELSKKYYDASTMYFLSYMHVLPAYQRRGLGQRLMEEAMLDADKDGAKAYLSASDAGRRLYVKYGFKDLEVKYVDFTHLGAIGARNTTAMMREPQSVRV